MALLVVGCPEDEPGGGTPDASRPRSGDSGTSSPWVSDQVSDTAAGFGLKLTLVDGEPNLAYYAETGRDDGPCVEVQEEDEPPPTRIRWATYLTTRDGPGFQEMMIADLLSLLPPQGLDVGDAGGTAQVAMLAGEAYNMGLQALCAAHNLGLVSPSGTTETLVEDSGEAPVDAASDAGFVVGHWPALAYGPGGQRAVFYRDIHFGGIQSDDERRADLEVVLGSGAGARTLPVNPGRGGGRFSDAVFDEDGNPYVAYVNDFAFDGESRGTLVARSMDDGDTWEIHRLAADVTRQGPSIWVGAAGIIHVAYYDDDRRQLGLATLDDPDGFSGSGWETTYLSSGGFDEGVDPSGATSADGHTAIAYYRCGRAAGSGAECNEDEDGLVVAHRAAAETAWTFEVVDAGPARARCGTEASAAFDDSGILWVGYVCETLEEDIVSSRVKLAERDPL